MNVHLKWLLIIFVEFALSVAGVVLLYWSYGDWTHALLASIPMFCAILVAAMSWRRAIGVKRVITRIRSETRSTLR